MQVKTGFITRKSTMQKTLQRRELQPKQKFETLLLNSRQFRVSRRGNKFVRSEIRGIIARFSSKKLAQIFFESFEGEANGIRFCLSSPITPSPMMIQRQRNFEHTHEDSNK